MFDKPLLHSSTRDQDHQVEGKHKKTIKWKEIFNGFHILVGLRCFPQNKYREKSEIEPLVVSPGYRVIILYVYF